MAWPSTAVITGDLITAAQLNGLPVRLADTTVSGSSVSSIDFTSIPSVYAHLLLVVYARSDAGGSQLRIRFNNDSGANYHSQRVNGGGSAASASEQISQTFARAGHLASSGTAANQMAIAELYVPYYANTARKKAFIGSTFYADVESSGGLVISSLGGTWTNTAAINRMTLICDVGNFTVDSRATLYGLA